MDYEIGFLGYGAMARAISSGLAASGAIPFERQIASDLDRAGLEKVAQEKGLAVAADNSELVRRSGTVVLAVKPGQALEVLEEIREQAAGRLFISLAAGIRLTELRSALPAEAGLVRSMPNVAALVGRGTSLICALPGSDPAHLEAAEKIFTAVGVCLRLEERYFDAAVAVSGSGPAYFFEFMEHLVRGAVRLGLSRDVARRLVLNTALGAAELALKDEASLAQLRDMVTSPGGTTAEALYVFEKGALGGLVQTALEAAAEKSRRLG